ncbi:MAG TPA: TonB-dependent receptor [Rhizomicrobium sp.]
MKKSYMLAVSVLAISSTWAQAQTAEGNTESTETVVVTGSLIARPGFSAPTPVSVMSADDLAKQAPVNIADALNIMPQFGIPGNTPVGGGFGGTSAGTSSLNLRNLGSSRTLVLLNGQRVVPFSTTNTIDLNTLPSALIKRVDVVTGGASAAYGSDAVAGVVNMILDTDFVGVKGTVQYGNTWKTDYENYKADISAGTSFDGEKGHIIASASYLDSPQQVYDKNREWYTGVHGSSAIVPNPAYTATNGQPFLIHVGHVGVAQATEGGLITAGPLKNTQFSGPNAVPSLFNAGTVAGVLAYGGNAETFGQDNAELAQPQHSYNVFARASYQLASNLKIHADVDFGGDGGFNSAFPDAHYNNINIKIDNPYLPAQTVAAMKAANITNFNFGTTEGNLGFLDKGFDSTLYTGSKNLERFSVGLDGAVGDWAWSAYYGHGEVHSIANWFNDPYHPYLDLASDPVSAPQGNSAGIPAGTIVCRSTLTNPTNGCAPLNLFGVHAASAAARAYVTPPAWTRYFNRQDSAQISVQGEPFSDWAGAVSLAGGMDWRSEAAVSTSDALSYTRQYYAGNNQPFSGAVEVWEGFAETIVPLAKNQSWSDSVDFNAAGRVTSYSTSGMVETWKLGLTDQITDEYRLRGTWSYDIRAPTLSELFTAASSGTRAQFDPVTGTSPNILFTTKGNPDLVPEKATTFSGGVVLTPNWLPGFNMSVDWYSINIKSAIGTTPNALTACTAGQTIYCQYVIRNAAGIVTEVDSLPVNTSQATSSGLDVEMDYTTDLWGGSLGLHGVASYTDESTSTSNNVVLDNAGSVGYDIIGGGEPKLRGTVTADFRYGPFSQTIQSRFFGSAVYSNAYAPGYIDDNSIPWVAYLDLRGSYDMSKSLQLFYAVDNVLNTPPPWIPSIYTSSSAPYTPPSRLTIYDGLGRYFRVGVRANF